MPKFPEKQVKMLPGKVWNVKKCLKWRTWDVKTKYVKKGPLGLGDFTPRTQSNLLETFVFSSYIYFFILKSAKNLLNMPTCLDIPAYYVM